MNAVEQDGGALHDAHVADYARQVERMKHLARLMELRDEFVRIATEGRRSLERAGGSVAEYLTEESPVLVPRAALPAFAQEVVALRDAVARVDKRVARLEKR